MRFWAILAPKKVEKIFAPHIRVPGSILLFLDMLTEKQPKTAKLTLKMSKNSPKKQKKKQIFFSKNKKSV